jgi:indole-3-glycerol phosphate synthase
MSVTTEKTMYLPEILAHHRTDVGRRKAVADFAALERAAREHEPRGFARALRAKAGAEGLAVIAELKKASPSKGILRLDYRPAAVAKGYADVGAAAISVLTDEEFFKGSLDDLEAVSRAVRIPVLRKDFMLDTYQIVEARAAGADAILLIVAAHTDDDLRELNAAAQRWGLDVLCEVHDLEELKRAVDLGVDAIGVNCRDLKTLQVDVRVHEQVVQAMPANVVRVAESGIRTPADIERLLSDRRGADAAARSGGDARLADGRGLRRGHLVWNTCGSRFARIRTLRMRCKLWS